MFLEITCHTKLVFKNSTMVSFRKVQEKFTLRLKQKLLHALKIQLVKIIFYSEESNEF